MFGRSIAFFASYFPNHLLHFLKFCIIIYFGNVISPCISFGVFDDFSGSHSFFYIPHGTMAYCVLMWWSFLVYVFQLYLAVLLKYRTLSSLFLLLSGFSSARLQVLIPSQLTFSKFQFGVILLRLPVLFSKRIGKWSLSQMSSCIFQL